MRRGGGPLGITISSSGSTGSGTSLGGSGALGGTTSLDFRGAREATGSGVGAGVSLSCSRRTPLAIRHSRRRCTVRIKHWVIVNAARYICTCRNLCKCATDIRTRGSIWTPLDFLPPPAALEAARFDMVEDHVAHIHLRSGHGDGRARGAAACTCASRSIHRRKEYFR